jgi:hypothetical protein
VRASSDRGPAGGVDGQAAAVGPFSGLVPARSAWSFDNGILTKMAPSTTARSRASTWLAAALLLAVAAAAAPAAAQDGAPPPGAPADGPSGDGARPESPQDAAEAATEEVPTAASPECQWAGQRILSLLWRDDIRTATDFLDIYDRFACPPDHVAVAFRCLVKIGVSPDQGDPGLPRRAQACWGDPNLDPAKLKAETAAPAGQQQPPEGAPAGEGSGETPQGGQQQPAEGQPQPQ